MLINDLFEKLENDYLSNNLTGELEYHKKQKYILWKYELESEDDYNDDYYDEDNGYYGFDSISNEEELQDTYAEDLEQIQLYFDEIGELDNFEFTDAITKKNVISFKIYQK